MSGCVPGCKWERLYNGTAASLADVAGHHGVALARISRLRDGLVLILRATAPQRFTALEREMGCRLSEVDDETLLAATQWLLEPVRDEAALSALRVELSRHGFPWAHDTSPAHILAAARAGSTQLARRELPVTPATPSGVPAAVTVDGLLDRDDKQPAAMPLDDLFSGADQPPTPNPVTAKDPEPTPEPAIGAVPPLNDAGNQPTPTVSSPVQQSESATQAKEKLLSTTADVPSGISPARDPNRPLPHTTPANQLPHVPAAELDELTDKIRAVVATGNPVFQRDIIEVFCEPATFTVWKNEFAGRQGTDLRFMHEKGRAASHGALILPKNELREQASTAKNGWWGACLAAVNGANLYEVAIVLHSVGVDNITALHVAKNGTNAVLTVKDGTQTVDIVLCYASDLISNTQQQQHLVDAVDRMFSNRSAGQRGRVIVFTRESQIAAGTQLLKDAVPVHGWDIGAGVGIGLSHKYASQKRVALTGHL